MAVLRPFLGLRFSDEAGILGQLIAPPQDSLTAATRESFALRSERNIVHVTSPEAKSDDRSKYIRYARATAALAAWRRDGYLVREEAPVLYRIVQRFHVRGSQPPVTRTALVGLMELGKDVGLLDPGSARAREDRLRLQEATRAQTEPALALVEDPDGEFYARLQEANGEFLGEVTTEDGVLTRLERIGGGETISDLMDTVRQSFAVVVSGIDKVAAADAYRSELEHASADGCESYVLAAVISSADPGAVASPFHRVIGRMGISPEAALERLESAFEVKAHQSRNLVRLFEDEVSEGPHVGMALEGGRGFHLFPRSEADTNTSAIPLELQNLGTVWLHRVMLEQMLGPVAPDAISYTADPMAAVRMADEGAAASFLLTGYSPSHLVRLARAGEQLPIKSVAFFPTLPSGLVLWSLNDY